MYIHKQIKKKKKKKKKKIIIFHFTIVQTQDPQVPAPVPIATADVTSPAEPCSIVSTVPSGTLLQAPSVVSLPRLWSETLPPEDHKWTGKRLFKMGSKEKPELHDDLQLWYYPPQPALTYNQAPAPDRFFGHALLLWMPCKLWRVKVVCPNPACGQHQLTGGGLHKRARQVLTLTECTCHIHMQILHTNQICKIYECILLFQRYACDMRHLARYTTQCVDFLNRPGVLPVKFQEPPEPTVVPSCKPLFTVYSQYILTKLDEIYSRITSTYGSVLKMDSTKKITKKLAGKARATGLWFTSVGKEFGQVLISVLTAQEGAGLDMMVDGLVKRYQQAGVDPPALLYMDCGCCTEVGETKLKTRFRGWPDLMIHLDIWHFMCRIALGSCIFEWDVADLSVLRKAKRALLMSQGWPSLADEDELALHCRRRTHGKESTILLLEHLFAELLSSKGNDSLGVPLLDRERMEHIWSVQKKHVKCIQDPPGVMLYTETPREICLCHNHCAYKEKALHVFVCFFNTHLTLLCLFTGTSANSLNFQIYLLEGLHRWIQDREAASLSADPSALRSYTGELVQCVNSNYEKLFGRKVVPTFCPPTCYTNYLLDLQGHTALSLTNQEANTIIAIWQNLENRDEQQVVYAAQHQKRLLSGHFRSTTRCVLGASSAHAQWPDCCLLVETIFIRLCTIHPSPKRKWKGALSRWSLILQD
ncbi:Penicillin-binding protein activator LpoB [Labeo rohita]|uniref:Penicillin-binding protein activator LpoB n=1 Tax=Labeo rohita TaxID=84645 RepID=A0ABQ8MTK4_LABRO|nr:Penicillin-binding protein activator LpoB [Labeo rohita]